VKPRSFSSTDHVDATLRAANKPRERIGTANTETKRRIRPPLCKFASLYNASVFVQSEQYCTITVGYQVKQWLFGGQSISTKAALFPLDAYKGHIVTDLFGEVENNLYKDKARRTARFSCQLKMGRSLKRFSCSIS
jgi:hypothetical protein